MARTINHRNYARCHKPVRQNADHVRACRWQESAVFYWKCWAAVMAEQTETTARELMHESNSREA
jgi:hypothetical protein